MPTLSQIVIKTIDSQILRDNPLGDPATRRLAVYLPPGYDDDRARYPTVYLLPGFTGRGYFMLNDSAFDEPVQERLDRLLAASVIQPLIVVLVDGFTRYGGSQYLNSDALGHYEDHLVQEIVPFIDQAFRTKAEPGCRAVAGKSSGGYGALRLAMRRPGLFGAVACHSGDLYFDYCYKPDFVKFINAAAQNEIESDETLAEFLASFQPKMQPKPPAFFDVLHIAAMSACYSPNPASPCGFDLPFDWHTGRHRPEVWQRWLAHDPVTMLDTPVYAGALRGLKLLYLDCGNRDEYALHLGARIFTQRLNELNIPHHYEEFVGGHRQTQFRYDVSLEMISEVFARK